MGDKKRRFVVERIKKAKKDKEEGKSPLDELDKKLRAKDQWHLLLLKDPTPYIQA
jgi:hypothetical protein|tara:strand:- start:249 stop:413 length:165 start_codon:yes stop_codon:yes gene_type:complete